MTLPDGHGRCLTHQTYDLDCADFERLRSRAGDRCEMPGCGLAGPDTKSGILYIDHQGPLGQRARVRGLLCCAHNAGIGRVEARPGGPLRRQATASEQEYLDRPFWREPESVAVQERKDAQRLHRDWLVEELAKRQRGRRSALDGMSEDDAISRVLDAGVRQAAIVRGTRYSQARVGRVARSRRQDAA